HEAPEQQPLRPAATPSQNPAEKIAASNLTAPNHSQRQRITSKCSRRQPDARVIRTSHLVVHRARASKLLRRR
ncbi:MAG: hypothetical protein SFV54_15605, partial [Bryobacteraceae bacterium]|nr:hypothetical protein [Bryobacteraceae bacterium]